MTGADGRRRVALVTDSSACLPSDEIARHRIEVVPIVLVWKGTELQDGIDITPHEFWRRLAIETELPTTSTMSPGAYLEAFGRARAWAGGVVCVCIPRRLSTMHEAALAARAQMGDEPQVEIVEAGGAAMASGFAALLAARAAAEGADLRSVASVARRASESGEILAVIDSLEFVARSGRLPRVVARIADRVPSTFMFRLHDRRISARARFGSRGRAIDGMFKAVRDAARHASYLGVAVHHGANDQEAVELAARIERDVRPDDLYVTSFTAVMGAHVGPGMVGVSICAMQA